MNKAYLFCKSNYRKKRQAQISQIANARFYVCEGKNPKIHNQRKKVNQVENIFKTIDNPKGLKAGKTF